MRKLCDDDDVPSSRCQLFGFCWKQEYLLEEGDLSLEAVNMIGDLLNIQSLMHMALTEMIYASVGAINDLVT